MDRAMIEQHLNEAERDVALGVKHVNAQRAIVARRERRGLKTSRAEALLQILVEMQELHEKHRDQLVKELAEAS